MKRNIHIVLVLTLTAFISAAVLASVNNWAEPLIEKNRNDAISQAIFQVHPSALAYEKMNFSDLNVFKVYDNYKNEIGYAVVHQGNGFQGSIKIIFGIDKDLSKVTSLEVLEQVETPGLGSLITEKYYKGQFQNLSVVPPVKLIKGKEKSSNNEVQAITGATISSRAVVNIVNDAMRILKKNLREGK